MTQRFAQVLPNRADAEGDMRCAILLVMLAMLGATAAAATPQQNGEFFSSEQVTGWISNYRTKPEPARLPAAVRALSRSGSFKDPESSGVYVGFLAGVIGANPDKAEELIGKMLPIPPGDQWAIIRAIAYSNHPDWMGLLARLAERVPQRQVMIDKYLEGKLPTLDEIPLEKKNPTLVEKMRGYFDKSKDAPTGDASFDGRPELLDTLWGYYFATGAYRPIVRIISLLPWSKDRDSIDKLTVGSMAKYTLASNAARDMELLGMLKRASKRNGKNAILDEVIEAAETMETTRVRKDALAAMEELKRKGPGYKRDMATWGQVGQGALALGCIAAAAAGQVAFGLPCVIGGATSSAVLNFWGGQQ
jgi:hypothetical protein